MTAKNAICVIFFILRELILFWWSQIFDSTKWCLIFPEGGKPDGLENPYGTAENQRTTQLTYGSSINHIETTAL